MQDLKSSITRVVEVLRSVFSEVVVTGSVIMNRVLAVKVRPEDAVRMAEALSSTFKDTAVLMDDLGFLNSLGALGTVRIRGSLVVFVYDIHDVRPFCELMGVPCLEPWDEDSLAKSIREARDYSEAFEVPYVVRVGPWLDISGDIKEVSTIRRNPTFNKNWGEVMRWGLNRLLSGFAREVPSEVLVRAGDWVVTLGNGDGVLVSGSAWPLAKNFTDKLTGYALVRTLYVNPLPKNLPNIKYVVDIDDYLPRRLGLESLMRDEVARQYNELVSRAVQGLFFRGAGDPLMIIEWFIAKGRRAGEVPIIILDVAYAHNINTEGLSPSYDVIPTYFEPTYFDQITDIVTNPIAAFIALSNSNYEYGRVIAVVSPCTLISNQDLLPEIAHINKTNNLLIIVNDPHDDACGEAMELLNKHGIKYSVISYDPADPPSALANLERAHDGGVIVIDFSRRRTTKYVYTIIDEYCDNCGDCLRIGCTAIRLTRKPVIYQDQCVGCGICQLVCTRGAITKRR
ncbi:MAG: 4Fe-4S binding protein [Vulcanisaeta sp.]|nr:4Fe-4S binding protein [Vulcanisaeta sp.]